MIIQFLSTIAFALSDLMGISFRFNIVIGLYLILAAIIINIIGFYVLTVTLIQIADL
jgi:hypothetical protein